MAATPYSTENTWDEWFDRPLNLESGTYEISGEGDYHSNAYAQEHLDKVCVDYLTKRVVYYDDGIPYFVPNRVKDDTQYIRAMVQVLQDHPGDSCEYCSTRSPSIQPVDRTDGERADSWWQEQQRLTTNVQRAAALPLSNARRAQQDLATARLLADIREQAADIRREFGVTSERT